MTGANSLTARVWRELPPMDDQEGVRPKALLVALRQLYPGAYTAIGHRWISASLNVLAHQHAAQRVGYGRWTRGPEPFKRDRQPREACGECGRPKPRAALPPLCSCGRPRKQVRA